MKSLTIKNILDGVNEKYYLPIIQRDYVWLKDPEKIITLFDSIYKGYPIGIMTTYRISQRNIEGIPSLIKFMESGYKKGINSMPIIKSSEISSDNEIFLFYDGQQRICSFLVGLKYGYDHNNKKQNLYFSPTKKDQNPDDVSDDKSDNSFKFFLSEELIKKEENKKYYSLKKLYEKVDIHNLKNSIKKLFPDTIDEEIELIEKFMKKILSDTLIHVEQIEDTSNSYAEMLEIFTRLNSGEKLNRTTLVLSHLYCSLRNNKGEEFRKKKKEFLKQAKDKGTDLDDKLFLKAIMFFVKGSFSINVKTIDDKLNDIFENYENIINKISEVIDIVSKEILSIGSADFSSIKKLKLGQIFFILAYYHNKKSIEKNDYEPIKEFIIKTKLKEYFSGNKTNEHLTKVRDIIDNHYNVGFGEILDKLKNDNSFKFHEEDIDNFLDLKYGKDNDRIFLLYFLLSKNLNWKDTNYHLDHVFPQNLYKNERNVDSFVNLQLLNNTENSEKQDMETSEWIQNKNQEFRRTHFLPLDNNLYNNMGEFYEARKKILKEELSNLFNVSN